MFGTFHHRTSVGLVLMMLLASLSPMGLEASVLLDAEEKRFVSEVNATTFSTGNTSFTLDPNLNEMINIDHEASHRLVAGSVDMTVDPVQTHDVRALSLRGGSYLGAPMNVTEVPTGLGLVEPRIGPDGAGLSSLSVTGNLSLNGSHAYNVLEVWGNLTTAATLTLVVNTLIVQTGGQISAAATITVGASPGGSTNGYGAPGAGGAGHALAGGAGGGQNAGAGGARYGNGTEVGSAGGDSSSWYHVNAMGGHGGGIITIRAGTMIVNGSITASGDDSMDGASATSGSGHGGAGGGGGSGGTVDVRCNTLTIGSYGNIQADGGDGGDGGPGAQAGPGIGMYNGGDGGGGGSGGFVLIAAQAGGFTNNGITSALGGAAGALGALYGSGRNGVAGYAGGVGNVNVSNWAGYPVYASAADFGTFTLDKWAPDNGSLVDGGVETLATIPINTTIDLEYRTTVQGDSFTDEHWSDWVDSPTINTSLPRLTWVQFRWTMERDGGPSPVLLGLEVNHSRWNGIDNLSVEIDSRTILARAGMSAHSSTFQITAQDPRSTNISVPMADGTAVDDLQLWLNWDVDDAGESLTVFGPQGELFSTNLSERPAGLDLSLDLSGITPPASDLVLQILSTTDVLLEMDHLSVPYRVEQTLDLAPVITAYMGSVCGEWYFATAACLADYRLDSDGDSNASVLIVLDDLRLDWIDDIAPRLDLVLTPQTEPLRAQENVDVSVLDAALEPGLSTRAWWSDSTPVDLIWDGSAYSGSLATVDIDPKVAQTRDMTVELTDVNGNVAIFESATVVPIHESMPQVGALVVTPTGNTTDLGDDQYGAGTASFDFAATDYYDREDLTASLHLSPTDGPELEIPLIWSSTSMAYLGSWQTSMAHIGLWTLEVEMRETSELQGFDADGLQDGVDGRINLVDSESPVLTRFDHVPIVMLGESFTVDIAWDAWLGEEVFGTLEVRRGQTMLTMESIPRTTAGEFQVTIDTTGYGAAFCELVLSLEDAAGNAVELPEDLDTVIEVTDREWIEGVWEVATFDGLNISLGGDHLFRTRGGALSVTVNGAPALVRHNATDAGWEKNVSLLPFLPGVQFIEATLCDRQNDTVCQTWNTTVNLDPMLVIAATASCNAPDRIVEIDENVTVVSCTIRSQSQMALIVALDDQVTTLESGRSTTLSFIVNTSDIPEGLSHSWTVTATNVIGESSLIESGIANLTFPTEEEEAQAETVESNSNWIWMALAGLVLLVILTLFMLRGRSETLLDDAFWPEIDAQPTSYDELGNEWYSTPEGEHWHRPAGMQDEWTEHEG